MRYVANIEMQFQDVGAHPARVRAAAAAGFDAVEFWRWEDLDVNDLATAAREVGVEVIAFATDWSVRAADPAELGAFEAAVRGALHTAGRLGARRIVLALGDDVPGQSLADTTAALTDALVLVAPLAAASGVTLLIEPLNTVVDHPGAAVSSAAHARELIARVDHPAVRMLFDVYHSAAKGEDVVAELAASAPLIDYVQLADAPGRHEPGSGDIAWPAIAAAVAAAGYDGPVGLEFWPTGDAAQALEAAVRTWDAATTSIR